MRSLRIPMHMPTTVRGRIRLFVACYFVLLVFTIGVSFGLGKLFNPEPYSPMRDGVARATERVHVVEGSFRASAGKDMGIQTDIGCEPYNNTRSLRATGFAYDSSYTVRILGTTAAGKGYTSIHNGRTDAQGFMYLDLDCSMPPGAYTYRLDSPAHDAWMEFQFLVYPLKQ